MLNSALGGSQYNTSEVAPTQAFLSNASGWIVGNGAPPLFWDTDFQTEVASATAAATPFTGFKSGSAIGNAIGMGPFNGTFTSGSWQITMSIRANTNGTMGSGSMLYRFWKSVNPAGAGAQLIDSRFFSSSNAKATAVNPALCTADCILNTFYCFDEYVFIQTGWRNNAAGGNVNADCNWNVGPATQSTFLTPLFHEDLNLNLIHENYDELV
jgi:hypothetical protein